MTSVSVAMATYNGSRFIREQLESVAAQTVAPAEIVVTDDASTDDTVAIVREFAGTVPFPVRIYENSNRLGYRANFMRNVGLCGSDIIALCDQDDIWDVRKLEEMIKPFAEPEVLLSYHEAWLINGEGERIGVAGIFPLPERNLPLCLFPMVNPYGFSMLFRRDLLLFSDLWDRSVDNLETSHRMAHDQWLFFLASVFGTIAYVDKPLADYRQHGNNAYGVGQAARTFWGRVGRWVDVGKTEYASFSVAAQARALILETALGRLSEPWHARARTAAASYRDLARHCALRSTAYNDSGAIARIRAWARLVHDGGYFGARWSFGRRTALKDLSFAILPRAFINAFPVPRRTLGVADRKDGR